MIVQQLGMVVYQNQCSAGCPAGADPFGTRLVFHPVQYELRGGAQYYDMDCIVVNSHCMAL